VLNKIRNSRAINIISKILNVLFVIGLGLIVAGGLFEDGTFWNIGLYLSLCLLVPVVLSIFLRLGFFNTQGNDNVVRNSQQGSQRSSNKKQGKFVYKNEENRDFICYSRYFSETGEFIDTLIRQEVAQNMIHLPLDDFVVQMSAIINSHLRFFKNAANDDEIRRMLVFYYRFKHLGLLEDGQFLRKSDNIILLDEVYNDGKNPVETFARIELAWIDGKTHLNCSVRISESRTKNNDIFKTLAVDDNLIFMPTIDIYIKYRQEIMSFFSTYIDNFCHEEEDELDSNGMALYSGDAEFYEFADDMWMPLFTAETSENPEKQESEESEVIINVLTGQLMYHSTRTYPYFTTFVTNHQTKIITYDELKTKLALADQETVKRFENMTKENWKEFVC